MRRISSLLALLLIAPTLAAQTPDAVVRAATRASELEGVGRLQERWTARRTADSTDLEALLGLATTALLTYRFDVTHTLTGQLLASTRPESASWKVYARLIEARALTAQSRFGAADSLLALTADQARLVGERRAEAEALLARTTTQARIIGPAGVNAMLNQARPLIEANDSALQANWHCTRAALLGGTDRSAAGREARTGIGLAEGAGEKRIALTCRFTTARLLLDSGQSFEAADSLGLIAEAFGAIHYVADQATALQWQGYALAGVGQYGPARRAALTAAESGRASGNFSAVAWANLNLTGIALLFGDLESAAHPLAEAESLFALQGDNWGLAALQGFKAALAESNGDLPSARAIYRKELARVANFDPDAEMQFRVQLAGIARRQRDYREAAAQLAAARSLAQRRGMAGWREALDYSDGILALAQGNLPAAAADLLRHLRTIGSGQPARRFVAESRLAEVYARAGNIDAAERRLTAATDSLESWRATLDDQALRLQVFDTREQDLDPNLGFDFVLGALARDGRAPAAFALAERRRARVLLDEMIRLAALQPDSATLQNAVSSLRRPLAPLTAQQIAALLPDDSIAILEYVAGHGDAPTTVFAISRGGVRAYLMPGLDSLAPAIARLAALLASGSDAGDLRKQLGTVFLAQPVADFAPTVRHLVIIPDGALHHLPFDALVLAEGQPVLARFGVTIDPSVAVMLRVWRRPADSRLADLLALGDPSFAAELSGRESAEAPSYQEAFAAHGGLPRLSGSADEAREVARFADRSELRLRDAASEAWLRRADLSRFRVLHLATHALVDERSATRTALALAPGEGEDGFVGPGDLAALHLNADLVVLSACRTARGVIVGGEGIQGLTAPLMQAGARTVLASEWPIEDRSSLGLLLDFYGGLADGLTADEALRGAQLSALRRGAAPAVWAAFTLVGDPLLRIPLHRPTSTKWWWAGGLLAALSLGYGWVRVKRTAADRGPPVSGGPASTHQA